MSRWIDAEYCEDFFDRWESRVKNAEPVTIDVVQNTRALLREAPSIDIVRCAECKYWHEYIDAKGQGRCDADEHNPFRVSIGMSTADFYCSYGEREGE